MQTQSRTRRRIFWICLALYLFCQIAFLLNIQFPTTPNFDEFHYIPSAKQFLALVPNQNMEHPPLGKLLMAVGIGLWGDRPIGWRFMSTIFGSLTLVGMYLWGLAVFESEATALWIAFLTLFNQILYVQARIGMLDTFMCGFLVWGLAAFCGTWTVRISQRQTRRWLAFGGVMLGLATACKWFAIVPWALCIGLVAIVRFCQSRQMSFVDPGEDDWYSPELWKGIRFWQWLRYLGLYPLLVYFATFIPYYFIHGNHYGLSDLLTMQYNMWDAQQRVVNSHPYMSRWTDWPLLSRPIWYAFDKEGPGGFYVRGVLCIGNPVIMWGGLIALLFCAWGFLVRKSRQAFLILVFYAAFYFTWGIIPRKIAFYYYYYPAALTLSLALAYVFARPSRGAASSNAMPALQGAPAAHEPQPMLGLTSFWPVSPNEVRELKRAAKKKARKDRGAKEISGVQSFNEGLKSLECSLCSPWVRWIFLAGVLGLFLYFFPILAALRIPTGSFTQWMWSRRWI